MTKRRLLIIPIYFLLILFNNCYAETNITNQPASKEVMMRIKLTVDNQEVIISLFDNPASQQLLNQLPLRLDFSDFASAEKNCLFTQQTYH